MSDVIFTLQPKIGDLKIRRLWREIILQRAALLLAAMLFAALGFTLVQIHGLTDFRASDSMTFAQSKHVATLLFRKTLGQILAKTLIEIKNGKKNFQIRVVVRNMNRKSARYFRLCAVDGL